MSKYIRKKDRIPRGPLTRSGGFSMPYGDKIIRRRPELQRYMKILRRDLIRDLSPEGEDRLSSPRRLILDRLLSKVAMVRVIEESLAHYGLIREEGLKHNVLEAQGVCGFLCSLNNQIRRDLEVLGLERRAIDEGILTPDRLLDAVRDDVAEAEVVRDAEVGYIGPTSGSPDDDASIEATSVADPSTEGGDE